MQKVKWRTFLQISVLKGKPGTVIGKMALLKHGCPCSRVIHSVTEAKKLIKKIIILGARGSHPLHLPDLYTLEWNFQMSF